MIKKILVVSSLVALLSATAIPWVYSKPKVQLVESFLDHFSMIEIPSDVLWCRQDSITGDLRCMRIPPGSFLLVPNPPDDSVPDHSTEK